VIERFQFVFDLFPEVSGDVDRESHESLWDAHYELQNALNTLESLQKLNTAERERLEQEVSQLRMKSMQEEVRVKSLKAENVSLQSQIEIDRSNQLLKQLRRSRHCANDVETYQRNCGIECRIVCSARRKAGTINSFATNLIVRSGS
jgi:hypothetical protein